jgi:hypothetical protein
MVKLTKLLKTVSKGLVVWVIYNPALNNWPQIAKIKIPQTHCGPIPWPEIADIYYCACAKNSRQNGDQSPMFNV